MTLIEEMYNASVEASGSGSGDSPHEIMQPYDTMMSDEGRRVLIIIFYVAFSGVISLLGSASNVINIIIFLKQGFSDTVNICLYGLAVSDLGSLLPLVWKSICFNPLFQYSDIEFDSVQVLYLTAGWPHGCFIGITSLITAFITFERCVCIALPMKVKTIITPKRTFISVVVIFIFMFAVVSPVFYSISFAPLFHIERNKTLVGLSYSNNGRDIENVSFSIRVFVQLSSYFIVIVCTVILVHNLRKKSQWRNKATATSSDYTVSISSRDKRVMKMVTSISCIFIVCLLPSSVGFIMMIHFSNEYSAFGTYHNLFPATWSVLNTLEAINGSISIIVYYNMSSRFRAEFNELFRKRFDS